MLKVVICIVCLTAWGSGAAAQASATASDGPESFALVVGSNVGGPGQQPLRYAERDAERVATTLVDIGRFTRDRVQSLLRPSRSDLSRALDEVEARLQAATAGGGEAVLVFYYSGHAQAQALNLGPDLFALSELRQRIVSMSGGLKIVVLDACQSGAFSRAKGAAPAADFSYNSVEQLRTAGVAVMASSSESELSQESEALQASYFTHHMLVALRGGGDSNHDGAVTLAETYQYAYHRTLASTAATAIGGQHVTLETELRGQGEVPLAYPAQADARLSLSDPLAADLVITHLPSRSVVAEVHKVAGEPMDLALAAGRYSVTVRASGTNRMCDVLVAANTATALSPDACPLIVEPRTNPKGGRAASPSETWAFEFGVGLGSHQNNDFTETLDNFGYGEAGNQVGRFGLRGMFAVAPYLSIGGQFFNLDSRRFSRDTQDVVQGYEWYSYALGGFVRAQPAWRRVIPYIEGGAGLTLAESSLDEVIVTDPNFVPTPGSDDIPPVKTKEHSDWHAGGYLGATAGLQVMPWNRLGFFVEMSWTYAPTIGNLLGDTHDVGGLTLLTGVRIRGLEAQ